MLWPHIGSMQLPIHIGYECTSPLIPTHLPESLSLCVCTQVSLKANESIRRFDCVEGDNSHTHTTSIGPISANKVFTSTYFGTRLLANCTWSTQELSLGWVCPGSHDLVAMPAQYRRRTHNRLELAPPQKSRAPSNEKWPIVCVCVCVCGRTARYL